MRFAYPRVLITDQGREFCNKEMGQFCNTNGINHMVTSAYCPQSNGLTERTNQTIKNGLRKALEGRRKEWPRFVNRVLYGIRLHRPRSTKESAYKLLYGFDARIFPDNKLEQLNQSPDEVSDDAEERRLQLFLEGVEERNELMQTSRAKARESIKIEQSKQKTAYDIAHAPPPFEKGSKVLLHSSRQLTRMAEQLEPNFTGPYIIDRITKANTVYLARMDGAVLNKTVISARLKLFVENSPVNGTVSNEECSNSNKENLHKSSHSELQPSNASSDYKSDDSIILISEQSDSFSSFKPPTIAWQTIKCEML
ncbi:hypothetical protein Aduo_006258 [Ancylostoma duodenale]